MPAFKHTNQMAQLKRIDPPAAAQAELLYKNGMWAMAGKVIAQALKTALAKANQPQSGQVWQSVKQMIESGNVPPQGKTKPVANGVSLFHRRDGYLVLRRGIQVSRPIGRWGRDFTNANSSYVGVWKLTDEASRNFETWAREVRGVLVACLPHED